MRADRLVATVLLLQRRGRVTAAELATELEVSTATARRDLEALSAAGVPVYPQPGRGGGWQLVGGARTDLTGLTAPESQALFVLLGPALTGANRGGPEARSAVAKLLHALPATFRDDAEAASRAIVVDPLRWGAAPPPEQTRLAGLQQAVVRRRTARFAYRAANGNHTIRDVHPYGLVDKGGTWYLLAGTDHGTRTFRVDRIAGDIEPGAHFVPPAGLDLTALWTAVAERAEAARSAVWADIEVPAGRLAQVLRSHFGRHVEETPDHAPEGWIRLRITAHLPVALAEQLAGWGSAVKVLGPPEVRAHLARIGHELVSAYDQPNQRDTPT